MIRKNIFRPTLQERTLVINYGKIVMFAVRQALCRTGNATNVISRRTLVSGPPSERVSFGVRNYFHFNEV